MTTPPNKKQLTEILSARNPSVDWKTRLDSPSRKLLGFLEGISLRLEAPIQWLIHEPRFNPLYHTGTITIFLLVVILITGIYLTMFYPFGFTFSGSRHRFPESRNSPVCTLPDRGTRSSSRGFTKASPPRITT